MPGCPPGESARGVVHDVVDGIHPRQFDVLLKISTSSHVETCELGAGPARLIRERSPHESSHSRQGNFCFPLVCDPIFRVISSLVRVPHSNHWTGRAVKIVAVGPKPRPSAEFLTPENVSRLRVCRDVPLRVATAETHASRPELGQHRTDQVPGKCSVASAHDAWALQLGPAEVRHLPRTILWPLPSEVRRVGWIRRQHGILVVRVRPLRQDVVIPTRSENRVRIDLEAEVLQSIASTQQQRLSSPRIRWSLGLLARHSVHAHAGRHWTPGQRPPSVASVTPRVLVFLPSVQANPTTERLSENERRAQLQAKLLQGIGPTVTVLQHQRRLAMAHAPAGTVR
mmetsp:Transcript_62645/g.166240  ORF Transcript_62645/g.166240 Transcript_62645/m.166240 type:complete len:341 (+) Transcript_62645:214-1236(+)